MRTAVPAVAGLAILFVINCGRGEYSPPASSPTVRRETGWSLLVRGAHEGGGYGLYSYLLFGRRPTGETEQKYLAAIEQLLHAAPSADSLVRSGLPRAGINNTYIPVTQPLPIDGEQPSEQAKTILANYDYARARVILNRFAERMPDGPYFVSASSPLSTRDSVSDEVLMQDLTLVTTQNVGRWVDAFITQAGRQDFRQPAAKQQLFLQLRNALSVVAELGPSVLESVETLVKWISPRPAPAPAKPKT